MEQRKISVKGITRVAHIEISSPVEEVFAYISAEESLPKFLKRYGPIHGIARWESHKGPWAFEGAYRTLHFEGGDTLREELIAFQPPVYFAYSISEFSSSARHLADIAYGEFSFEGAEKKTYVSWRYTFKPKNFFTAILLSLFMSLYFKPYMQQGLEISKKDIEGSAGGS